MGEVTGPAVLDPLATGRKMHAWATELFPVCRSITGDGQRQTISFIRGLYPQTQVHSFATGEQVFDWTIPQEWNIRDAWLEHESGARFAEFSMSNLHVLNYSEPVDVTIAREELLERIYTQPDQPDRIPYVTSYYKRRWGFCMSQNMKDALPPGNYRARIDSTLSDGELCVADLHLPGECEDEILFSTYICHPSLANNELSGPVLAMALAGHLSAIARRRFSYRFLFVPETIGSLAYLSRHLKRMQRSVRAGFVLSCVGDERAWSHVRSRRADTLADAAVAAAIAARPGAREYSFLDRGSDERQYCAPGIDLPVCGFCRSKYGEFPEYHTDADDLSLITPAGLQGSFDAMLSIVEAFETGPWMRATIPGEPQLGRRGLYPTVSRKGGHGDVGLRMNVLAYSDGANSLFDIARITGAPLDAVVKEARLLAGHGLLEPLLSAAA